MVSPIEEVGIKETRYKCSNIIIRDTTLRNIYHLKSRIRLPGTNACVVVSVAFLPKACNFTYWNGVTAIWNISNIKATTWKTWGLVNYQVVYIKHIKMQWNRMDATSDVLLQIWICKKWSLYLTTSWATTLEMCITMLW